MRDVIAVMVAYADMIAQHEGLSSRPSEQMKDYCSEEVNAESPQSPVCTYNLGCKGVSRFIHKWMVAGDLQVATAAQEARALIKRGVGLPQSEHH